MKVLTILGTRPEIIKLSRVIIELDKYVDHCIVHTGQNYDYELNQVFFDQLEIRKPDYFLGVAEDSVADTIANIISKSDKVFSKEQPDALLVYGDTNSCLSVISAKRRKIPVFHMEAGNRCFDLRVPEEINRKIVDQLSDINMVISEHARRYLIQEGVRPETIIKTGSSMREVLDYHLEDIEQSDVLVEEGLKPQGYILVSLHREENIDSPENFRAILSSLKAMVNEFSCKVIFSTHPRTRKKLESLGFIDEIDKIELMKPFGFFEYIKLQKNALCVVSDSGTISEEASLLKIPAVTVRQAHERPEGMDGGTVIMTGVNQENILLSMRVTINLFSEGKKPSLVEDYESEHVSMKVIKTILSYKSYINRTVWRKDDL